MFGFKREERVSKFGLFGIVCFERKKDSVLLFLDAREIQYVRFQKIRYVRHLNVRYRRYFQYFKVRGRRYVQF